MLCMCLPDSISTLATVLQFKEEVPKMGYIELFPKGFCMSRQREKCVDSCEEKAMTS